MPSYVLLFSRPSAALAILLHSGRSLTIFELAYLIRDLVESLLPRTAALFHQYLNREGISDISKIPGVGVKGTMVETSAPRCHYHLVIGQDKDCYRLLQ
ncbi:hypothetical protein BDV06DRAFT_201026 [Aspergillus oleicola]